MLICKKKTHAPTPIFFFFFSMAWTDPICVSHVMQKWESCGKGRDMGLAKEWKEVLGLTPPGIKGRHKVT